MRHTAKTKARAAADKWLVGAAEARQRLTLLPQLGAKVEKHLEVLMGCFPLLTFLSP